MVAGYLLLVLFTLSVVFALLYTLFADRQQQSLNNIAMQISDSMQKFDVQLGSSLNAVRQFILSSSDAYSLLYGDAEDYARQYTLYRTLAPIISQDSTMESISLFNAEHHKLIYRPLPPPLTDTLEETLLSGDYTNKAFVPYQFMGKDYLSCLFMLNSSLRTKENAVLAINLDCSMLSAEIEPILNEQTTLLLSNENDLLLSTGAPLKSALSEWTDWLSRHTGHEEITINGEKWLAVQHLSSVLPWRLVSLYPLRSVALPLDDLNLYLVSPFFIILFFGFCWLLFNRSFRKPIIQLFNLAGAPQSVTSNLELDYLQQSYITKKAHMQKLENDVSQLIGVLSDAYYSILLAGGASKLADIAAFSNPFVGPHYVVLLADTHAQDERICIETDQLLRDMANVDRLTVEGSVMIYLKQLSSAERLPEAFLIGLEAAQREFNKKYNLPLTLSVGSIVSTLDQIDHSCQAAREAMKYTVLYGKNSILQESMCRPAFSEPFVYPGEIEQLILQAVERMDTASVRKGLERFQQFMYQMDVESIGLCYHQLSYNVLIRLSPLPGERIVPFSLADCTLDEALELLLRQLEEVVEYKKKNQKESLAQQLLQYTQDHMNDPAFSLSALADAFDLSTGYVSRVYKEHCGIAFSESLSTLRLETCARLLRETDMPLAQIAQETGYNTTSYFHSCFKKSYGMTPGQYRKQYGNGSDRN